jgi:hypothetical protein
VRESGIIELIENKGRIIMDSHDKGRVIMKSKNKLLIFLGAYLSVGVLFLAFCKRFVTGGCCCGTKEK